MRAISPLGYMCLALFVLFQLLTQPFFVLAGDPVAVRHETRHLLRSHELGIPFEQKDEIPQNFVPPKAEPDQFFWENQARQKYFSRWGIGNTLSFLVPLSLIGPEEVPNRLVLALNCWNVVLATLIVAALTAIATQSGAGLWGGLAISGFVCTTTLYYYLRAQGSETLQMALLALIMLNYRALSHRLDLGVHATNRRGPLVLAVTLALLLSALTMTKVYFCLFFGLTLLTLFWGRHRDRNIWPIAFAALAVMAACGLAQLWLNYYKFGNALEMGLGPAFPRSRSDWYSLSHFKDSIPDYLIGRNGSVFIFFPLVLFSLLGARPHARAFRRESWLIWLNFLMIILVAGGWKNNRGEWCFGPRYLVPAVLLTVIPALFAWRRVAGMGWLDVRRFGFSALFFLLVCVGARRQFIVSQLDFFAVHQVSGSLEQINQQLLADDYFKSTSPFAISEDLLNFCRGGREGRFHVLDRMIRLTYPDLGEKLDQLWRDECSYNAFFWALDKSQWFK